MMPAGCIKNTDIFASILSNLMLPMYENIKLKSMSYFIGQAV